MIAADESSQYTVNIGFKFRSLEINMKLYTSLFIASISMPVASIAGICSLEFGYVSSIRQALGIGVLAGAVMLLIALILFLAGIPATLHRLRLQTNSSN